MGSKKVIYIAGPITGVPKYKKAFDKAEAEFAKQGYTVLNPTHLPGGMTNEQYIHICFAMIDCADAAYFLPGWYLSEGATLEHKHCQYVGKPRLFGTVKDAVRFLEKAGKEARF